MISLWRITIHTAVQLEELKKQQQELDKQIADADKKLADEQDNLEAIKKKI